MQTSTEFIEAWVTLAERVGKFVASDFPDIDSEEITAMLLLFLTEKKLLDSDPETDGYAAALNRKGHWFAWQQRKEHLVITSQYAYRTKDISVLMETLFDYAKWPDATVPEDGKSYENSHATDGIEMSSDLSRAFAQLPAEYREALYRRYALQEIPTGGSAPAKVLTRAKQRVADILNTGYSPDHDGPGSRKTMTNARARYELDS